MHQLLEAVDGNYEEQEQIFQGVQRLVDPDGMGGLYKALALRCIPSQNADASVEPPFGFGGV